MGKVTRGDAPPGATGPQRGSRVRRRTTVPVPPAHEGRREMRDRESRRAPQATRPPGPGDPRSHERRRAGTSRGVRWRRPWEREAPRSERRSEHGADRTTRAAPEIHAGESENDLVECARRGGRGGGFGGRSRGAAEEATSDREPGRNVTRRHQAMMTYLDETPGQDVQNEAPKELGG